MKQRLLTVAAGAITVVAALLWALQGAEPVSTAPPATGPQAPSPATTPPIPAGRSAGPRPEDGAAKPTEQLASYAIATAELQGLPPDLPPGSIVDIWVTWQPPITKRAKVQPLLERVRLEEIAPPLLPDGPHAAILAVPPERISDLIWGDRFGALSVVVPPAPAG